MLHRLKKWFGISDETGRVPGQPAVLDTSTSEDNNITAVKDTYSRSFLSVDQTDAIEDWIRRHVQIKPEDCLGCKIVATVTVTFIVGTVASQIPNLNKKLPPKVRGPLSAGQYLSLGVCTYAVMKVFSNSKVFKCSHGSYEIYCGDILCIKFITAIYP